jgi:CPA2 family monovalent cation:H+ antiporter-2
LFVTLFFGSIGMLGDPRWAAEHAPAIVVGVAAVVAGKAIVAAGAVRLFGSPMIHAAATGLCLAQVGEFSFVLAESARAGGVIDEDLFKFVVSVTIATLFLTPMLCASAPRLMRAIERADAAAALEPRGDPHACAPECYVVIIGFGPAGRRVAERLVEDGLSVRVVDLNPRTASASSDERVQIQVGDAATVEVLEHVGTAQAAALIVTIPDPAAARLIVRQSKRVAPATPVIARARYHLHRDDLREAGADEVVDEEWEIGLRIAEVVRGRLRVASAEAPRAD